MEDTLPSPSGHVILYTSMGDLELHLFANEAPQACRNFIQLCLEDYYVGCMFFRLVAGFMMQGGDPTNSGEAGESVFGQPFPDEFHQRLKFQSRGLLGMANRGPHSNQSQFFLTFDKCHYLDNKNTLFGKLVGNTVYNLLQMEKIEVDSQDRPTVPITITATKVVTNPFQDILVRQPLPPPPRPRPAKASALRKAKNKNLLSFQEDEVMPEVPSKVKSVHDVCPDRRMARGRVTPEARPTPVLADPLMKKVKGENIKEDQVKLVQNPETQELLKGMKRRVNKRSGRQELYWSSSPSQGHYSSTSSDQYHSKEQQATRQQQKQEYDKLKIELLHFKKHKTGTQNPVQIEKKHQEIKLLSNLEKTRMKYVLEAQQRKKDKDVLQRLAQFTQKVNSQTDENYWLNNKLKFHVDSANAYQQYNTKQQAQQGTLGLPQNHIPDQ